MSSFQMTDSQLLLDARLPSLIESTISWQRDAAQRREKKERARQVRRSEPVVAVNANIAAASDGGVAIRFAEEVANTASHALGMAFSILASIPLMVFAGSTGSIFHIIACAVYGATALTLYTASTLYHAAVDSQLKRKLQRFDHVGIYLFIAGSYTPFLLTALRGPLGWTLLTAIWAIAAVGIWVKCTSTKPFTTMSAVPYVAMGWLVVFAIKPLIASLPFDAFAWLVAGGLFYTAGVYYYVRDSKPYNHFIWHLFVLAGSVCHFLSITATVTATAP